MRSIVRCVRRFSRLTLSGIIALIPLQVSSSLCAQDSKQEALQQEEQQDYYSKWLNEDVVYIITEEERDVFKSLTTDEEKENFIEQFWRRRDPDLKTAQNEFKEEHYRRIAYANERFTSGKSGWKTDRGRIYIIHGPPTEITENTGGTYDRPLYEGGGTTTALPFQVWRYREVAGLGSDIELEFVDSTLTGDYHLTSDPWEKDAFNHVPGIGLTLAEERKMVTKGARFYQDNQGDYYPMMALRAKDRPFERLERYSGIMRPLEIKYKDLKESVDVNVGYSSLPFQVYQFHFRLNEHSCIVPVTLEVSNRNLTFKEENGVYRAKMAIYGAVTGLGNEVIKEFEDDLVINFPPEQLEAGRLGTSMFQKVLILEKARRVKLDLVLKDTGSGNVGVVTKALTPPDYGEEDLQPSSLILSDTIVPLKSIPDTDSPFVLGDLKVRPRLDHVFPADKLLAVYFQLYNAGLDQQTMSPSLNVTYRLMQGGRELMKIEDNDGESIQFFSSQRVVLLRAFSPRLLGVGKYRLLIDVQDKIKNESAILTDEFEVVSAGESTVASN